MQIVQSIYTINNFFSFKAIWFLYIFLLERRVYSHFDTIEAKPKKNRLCKICTLMNLDQDTWTRENATRIFIFITHICVSLFYRCFMQCLNRRLLQYFFAHSLSLSFLLFFLVSIYRITRIFIWFCCTFALCTKFHVRKSTSILTKKICNNNAK